MKASEVIADILVFIARQHDTVEDKDSVREARNVCRLAWTKLHTINRDFAFSIRNTDADPWNDPDNLGRFFAKINEYFV